MSFEEVLEAHRARLRLHCYRMVGSTSDADDVVQETFARAVRSRHTLEDLALARPWLYRIATNVCLDELASRARRARGGEEGAPSDPDLAPAAATDEREWIEPVPGTWLAGADPAAAYTIKESVALAFVAALQVLTPSQRAVLLLRDVVELTGDETASALGITVSAANSALHRAREALAARVGPKAAWSPEVATVDRSLLERYLQAWGTRDLDVIVALLHEEVVLSMPPRPTWLAGRAAVGRFFAHRIGQAVAAARYRVIATQANGRDAVAFYRRGDDGRAPLFALHVLELEAGGVRRIDHFMGERALGVFVASGILPAQLG